LPQNAERPPFAASLHLSSHLASRDGYGNKEIAGRLRVSESDVKKPVSRLMRVLATDSRVGLVRAAIAKGLIKTSDDVGTISAIRHTPQGDALGLVPRATPVEPGRDPIRALDSHLIIRTGWPLSPSILNPLGNSCYGTSFETRLRISL
jgi:hypothetical protein